MSTLFSNRSGDDPAAIADYVRALLDLAPDDPVDALSRLVANVREAVAGMSEEQLRTPEKPGKWSMRDVVRHLNDAELVLAWRYRMILAHDSPPIAGYDQDLWAARLDRDDSLEVILGELEAVRTINVRLLRRQPPEAWQRVGLHAERGPESLDRLVHMAAGHDVVHTRQLQRIRAAVV